MKVTLKAVLWAKDTDKEGMCPVAISITGGGQRTYYNTGKKVKVAEWDKPRSNSHADIVKKLVRQIIADAEKEILIREMAGDAITLDIVKHILNPERKNRNGSFHAFYKDYVDYLASKHTPGYIKHYKVEMNQLKAYAPTLSFSDVTADFLERYEMQLTCKAASTKHTKMKRLKEVVKRAVAKGKINFTAVASYKLPPDVEGDTPYLTLAEVQKIEEKLYSGHYDTTPIARSIVAYFLLECHSGIRFSDWKRFTVETLISERNLKLRAKKNKQPIYLSLETFKSLGRIVDYIEANKIVYDLTEQFTNRELKDLKKIDGIDQTKTITTHVGRHTFGTLLGEMGYTTRFIAEAMGISEKTAKRYVKTTRQGMEHEMKVRGAW